MTTNPILDEVRDARAAFAEELGHDLKRIQEWAKAAHQARNRSKDSSEPLDEIHQESSTFLTKPGADSTSFQ